MPPIIKNIRRPNTFCVTSAAARSSLLHNVFIKMNPLRQRCCVKGEELTKSRKSSTPCWRKLIVIVFLVGPCITGPHEIAVAASETLDKSGLWLSKDGRLVWNGVRSVIGGARGRISAVGNKDKHVSPTDRVVDKMSRHREEKLSRSVEYPSSDDVTPSQSMLFSNIVSHTTVMDKLLKRTRRNYDATSGRLNWTNS